MSEESQGRASFRVILCNDLSLICIECCKPCLLPCYAMSKKYANVCAASVLTGILKQPLSPSSNSSCKQSINIEAAGLRISDTNSRCNSIIGFIGVSWSVNDDWFEILLGINKPPSFFWILMLKIGPFLCAEKCQLGLIQWIPFTFQHRTCLAASVSVTTRWKRTCYNYHAHISTTKHVY